MNDFQQLLNEIDKLNKTSTVLIAIDGFGGSGKSTLTEKIKNHFPDATIVHLDDFYSHELNRADRERLINQVIKPLKSNQTAKYQRYDWGKKELTEWIEINPGKIILIEGVSTLHDDFNHYYDFRLWIDYPQEEGFKRGLERDKKEYGVDTTDEWLNIWIPQEKEYFKTQKPKQKADLIVKLED
jgi:uridine kinase